MSRNAVAAVVLGILATAGPARADDEAPPPEATRGDHHGQLGLALSLVTGSRFIKTYDADIYCGDRATAGSGGGNATYCFTRVPVALDLGISYGVSSALELMLEVRLGLERDFGGFAGADGPRLRHYAPGVRFFLAGKGQLQFTSTAQLAFDLTGYEDATGNSLGAEVRLRNANGLQFDFHDAYGVYAFFAEEVAFRRWLEVGLEGGIGVQGRYP